MIDTNDRKILQRIQSNLPLTSRPFLTLAEELGLEEDHVIERIKYFCEEGYVRRLAPIINTQKVGRYATLAAINVPDERITEVSELINGYSTVSHNYLRKGKDVEIPFNMWFTMSAASKADLDDKFKEIEEKTGLKVLAFPTTKKFKIGVKFKIYKEDNV